MIEITRRTMGNEEMTALRFGPDKFEIPIHLMQKEREHCLLITDEDILHFPWNGITKDTMGQYLLLPLCNLEDIWTLSTTNRSNALSLIRKIAIGIKKGGKKFADLSTGVFPLYRIYIKDKKDILLLPPDAASVLGVSLSRIDMDRSSMFLTKKDVESGYTLTLEMAQLLYYAASGRFPYEKEEVRRSGYNEIPLEFYSPSLPEQTLSFISRTLSMKERSQRKISGNYGPEASLGWFLDSTTDLEWNQGDRSEEEKEKDAGKTEENPEFLKLWKDKTVKARRRNFWVQKGPFIALMVLLSSFVLYFLGNYLYQTFRPPVTRDLDPVGVIEHMYECQNSLDSNRIDEGFKGEVAQFNEVLNIYVSSTTRKAYENIDAIKNAKDWLDEGSPAINKDTWIYGVIPESIEKTGEDHYRAILKWYTPFAFEDGDEELYPEKDDEARIFVYTVTQEFDFKWNNRGWWVCTYNEITSYSLDQCIYSETV